MVLTLSLIIAAVFIVSCQKALRKKAAIFYAFFTLVSLLVVAGVLTGRLSGLSGLRLTLSQILTQGGLAGAFFIYVMYVGAMPKGSRYIRLILPIRGQLSIIACILTLGHNIAYGKTYFVLLFTQAANLRWNILAAAVCSLVMIMIMLPLFITSFLCVRKRMAPKKWKKLQRLAYVFYALLYIHILLLNLPSARNGSFTANLNVALYSVVFLTYAYLRIGKYLTAEAKRRTAEELARRLKVVHGLFFGLIALLLAALTIYPNVRQAMVFLPGAAEQAGLPDGKYSGAGMGYNGGLSVSGTLS